MRHPFVWLSEGAQRHALVILLLLVFALTTTLAVLGAPLRSPEAPRGIVSFELAGSAQAAQTILDSWSPGVRELAMLNLGLDYLYLVAYPALLALACTRVAGRLKKAAAWSRTGTALAWAVLLAGVLDAAENTALIHVLASGPSDAAAALARACALPKFGLVFAALAYCVLGLARSALLRRTGPAPT